MGSTDPLKSYCLLNMKMNEIVNLKKDETGKESQRSDQAKPSTSKSTLPTKSTADVISNKSLNKQKEFTPSPKDDNTNPKITDHSYGDLFCRVCEKQMNSESMWYDHIAGKKHQKKIRKSIPVSPPKQYIISDDEEEEEMNRIKKESSPSDWKAVDYHKRDNLKDCRAIIEERRRKRAYSSDEEARTAYYNHSKKHKPSSPYFRKSSKMEKAHSGTSNHTFPEDRSKPYTCSPPPELLKKKMCSSRNSTFSPPYERSYSRSQIEQKESSHSKNYSLPTETKNQEPNFFQKLRAFPTDIFLKTVRLKLDNIEIKEFKQLSLLGEVLRKAQTVFANKIPPDIEAVVRQQIFRNIHGSPQMD